MFADNGVVCLLKRDQISWYFLNLRSTPHPTKATLGWWFLYFASFTDQVCQILLQSRMALLSSDLAPCELWTIFSESSIIGFEFCMIFWSSTPGFTSIWNGSLFDWYGSLGALDHIFIFYILYIWIPHDFLNKMADFQFYLEWLTFWQIRLSRSSGSILHLLYTSYLISPSFFDQDDRFSSISGMAPSPLISAL